MRLWFPAPCSLDSLKCSLIHKFHDFSLTYCDCSCIQQVCNLFHHPLTSSRFCIWYTHAEVNKLWKVVRRFLVNEKKFSICFDFEKCVSSIFELIRINLWFHLKKKNLMRCGLVISVRTQPIGSSIPYSTIVSSPAFIIRHTFAKSKYILNKYLLEINSSYKKDRQHMPNNVLWASDVISKDRKLRPLTFLASRFRSKSDHLKLKNRKQVSFIMEGHERPLSDSTKNS